MDEQKINPIHGGNIYRLAEELNIDEREIIDFSASINPLGAPKDVLSAIKEKSRHLFNYPDPDAEHLTQAIAQHIGISPQSIICGNGSTELIYLVVRALKPEKVLIPAPTFSEYERAVGDPKKVEYFILWEKNKFDLNIDKFIAAMSGSSSSATYKSSLTTSVDVAFLCNPNNPTGRLLKKEDVLKIANAAKDLRCYLVVDEAFIDFLPYESVIKEVENNPYLIVLRSMTKFYALSGLRVGYCAAHKSVLNIIKEYKEPWTVNTLAQAAGTAALDDKPYRDETFKVMRSEKKTLEDGFRVLKITYFQSSANFYLLKFDNAQEIISRLRSKGIMVRDCSNFMGLDNSYIRVAVKSNKDNMRLLKELANLCVPH
ncbi:MAG: threonine-phosphate decarboxylase [Nitrospirae bacterium]|nr:threonine-phosphate decarboxylase [Nitrospirota bacterium]